MDNNRLFVLGWFLVTFVLIYLPVDYQIHLLNGWQVPMAILATTGLFDYVLPWIKGILVRSGWREKWSGDSLRLIVAASFILAVIPTNLYLFAWRFLIYPGMIIHITCIRMNWPRWNGWMKTRCPTRLSLAR